MPEILAAQEQRSGGSGFTVSPGEIVFETLSQKHPTQNRAGGVTQVVECLPSKYEAGGATDFSELHNELDLFF
jgi:hypothetical protein